MIYLKKLLQITDQQANSIATSIAISNTQRAALANKVIVHKLTTDTVYTQITILQAIGILKTSSANYGQNVVDRLANGEIIYYPSGEIKLEETKKCGNCASGYLGDGIVSTIDDTKTICQSCARGEMAQQIADMLNLTT